MNFLVYAIGMIGFADLRLCLALTSMPLTLYITFLSRNALFLSQFLKIKVIEIINNFYRKIVVLR